MLVTTGFCAHPVMIYNNFIALLTVSSFLSEILFSGTPGNGKERNLENFPFFVFKKFSEMATPNCKLHGKKLEIKC